VAWHYDPSGSFSVKSAYRLAYNLKNGVRWRAGNSAEPDNSRKIWKIIWRANVPKKVRIFGWRVACDNLATKRNKLRRTLEMESICNICGTEEEDSYHATVKCTKSRALRYEMRKHWDLPPERAFSYTGTDWLQNLLINSNKIQRSQVLMLLWRSWHLRCDIYHGKGDETIARSVAFLIGYDNFLNNLCNKASPEKGLSTSISGSSSDTGCSNVTPTRSVHNKADAWSRPSLGEMKMNVDAAFCASSHESTAGVVIRDHLGYVIITVSITRTRCINAEEAEAFTI
jgi:hypothetical protein